MSGSSPRPPQSTIKDVAARAHVSVGTVSNVLNRPETVSPGTRQQVLDAMKALGFVRHAGAAMLRRSHRTSMVGVIVLNAASPFFAEVAAGAEDVAREDDRLVVICSSAGDREREGRYFVALEAQRVAGIIVSPVGLRVPEVTSLRARGVAVVLLERQHPDFCSVEVNGRGGAEQAVGHLIGLGHREIAYVSPPLDIPQYRQRWEGAEAAAAGHALVHLVRTEVGPLGGTEAGSAAAADLLTRHPEITGFFCANDLVALGLMSGLARMGYRIPEDVSVVGFDDVEGARFGVVPLTTVRQPARELGRRATELMLAEAAAGPDHHHEHVVFDAELVIRESTGAPRTGGRPHSTPPDLTSHL
ncbi:transcriptional regulator, LacI family [Nakamurella panacisegetis]|uniref:Transcriptional regulator, LacI family n=1 Tax=Nakamurella panacisegetis TaxID=1090615 RepID=A0A1H0LH27_9ACTN|nr:LacI family DNA-binding transcriptional regulator [Nakamurella panacisegetis]SDO67220.1 transcriptional regulator, LacI family [Nakamurella panacisegetis]